MPWVAIEGIAAISAISSCMKDGTSFRKGDSAAPAPAAAATAAPPAGEAQSTQQGTAPAAVQPGSCAMGCCRVLQGASPGCGCQSGGRSGTAAAASAAAHSAAAAVRATASAGQWRACPRSRCRGIRRMCVAPASSFQSRCAQPGWSSRSSAERLGVCQVAGRRCALVAAAAALQKVFPPAVAVFHVPSAEALEGAVQAQLAGSVTDEGVVV